MLKDANVLVQGEDLVKQLSLLMLHERENIMIRRLPCLAIDVRLGRALNSCGLLLVIDATSSTLNLPLVFHTDGAHRL